MRLVIVMALVAGLAWAVPIAFFGRQQTAYVGSLAGGQRPDAPVTAQPVTGGGSVDVLAPSETTGPADPIGQAEDALAQANLNEAIRIAEVYAAENASYAGLDATVAASFAPSITFTSGAPAAPEVVSIRGVSATTVVFVTASTPGALLCAAAAEHVVSFGRVDAQTPLQCSGGWD
jgi:hypothetical protein